MQPWSRVWSGTRWLREWQRVWELCRSFQAKAPVGSPWFRSVPGPCLLQLTGPSSGPSSCQDEENRLSRHTVTGADAVFHVCHSFHFLRHAIDSLARVTLVTLSFNLLQRAWPVEHISRGWEQTLGYWSPNGNYHFLCGCFLENPRPQQHFLIWGMFLLLQSLKGRDKIKPGAKAKKKKNSNSNSNGDCARREIYHRWLINKEKKIGGLAYHFLTNIWNLRKTSIRALSHSALRNSGFSGVLSEQFDIFSGAGTGGCAVSMQARFLLAKLKVILREWKLMWAINFSL